MHNHLFSDSFRADDAKKANLIGQKLLTARKKKGLKQSDITSRLHKYGINISDRQVSKWENGNSIPNAYQFLALCCTLKLDPAYFTSINSSRDSNRIEDNNLSAEGELIVAEIRRYLAASGRYAPK